MLQFALHVRTSLVSLKTTCGFESIGGWSLDCNQCFVWIWFIERPRVEWRGSTVERKARAGYYPAYIIYIIDKPPDASSLFSPLYSRSVVHYYCIDVKTRRRHLGARLLYNVLPSTCGFMEWRKNCYTLTRGFHYPCQTFVSVFIAGFVLANRWKNLFPKNCYSHFFLFINK